MSERERKARRERELSKRAEWSISTPDILSGEAVHAIRIAATPAWRVDVNVVLVLLTV